MISAVLILEKRFLSFVSQITGPETFVLIDKQRFGDEKWFHVIKPVLGKMAR